MIQKIKLSTHEGVSHPKLVDGESIAKNTAECTCLLRVVRTSKNRSVCVRMCVLSVATLQIATTISREIFSSAAWRCWLGRSHR